LDQSLRTKTLDGFRDGSIHLLIASDVAARGLDIPAVSHVFNFDVPSHPEDYVHRIGRTGRAGRAGKAFTIAVPFDDKYLGQIEALVKQPIPRGELPEGALSGGETRDAPRPIAAEDTGESAAAPRERARRSRGGRGKTAERTTDTSAAMAVMENSSTAEDSGLITTAETENRANPRQNTDRREPRAERRQERNAERAPARPAERAPERNWPDRTSSDRAPSDRAPERRYRDYDRGPAVIGMGDHMPEFLTRSFKIAARTNEGEDQAPSP
jgi:superfamily II DNA/RNA helicase